MREQGRYSSLAHGGADISDRRQSDNMSTASTNRPESCDPMSRACQVGCTKCGRLKDPSKLPQEHAYEQYSDYKAKNYSHTDTGFSSNLSQRLSFGPRRSASVHFLRDWWLELISCFFLLGGLVAIIVTARAYEGKPLPKLPQGLSINSVFAIYVVVLKAAMLLILAQGLSHLKWTWFQNTRPLNDLARYDNASRGPLGSLWLLFTLKGRDLVSSIGAILILAAVILDPMAQQVIRYYNCPQPQSNINATLPRTNAYMEVGLHAGAGYSTIPRTLQSAINGGLFVPGSQVNFYCPSGNCTFSETSHTVGYGSTCVDISDQLSFTNTSIIQTTMMSQYDDSGNVIEVPVNQNYTTLKTSLPSGLSTNYNSYSANVTYMAMQYNMSTATVEVILGPQISSPQVGHAPYCSGSTLSPAEQATNWGCRGWGAASCTIYPAVYAIESAKIESGQLTEKITQATTLTSPNSSFVGNSIIVADVSDLPPSTISSLRERGYVINSTTRWIPYNISLDVQTNTLISSNPNASTSTLNLIPRSNIYQMFATSASSLGFFFADYFTGEIKISGSEYTGPSTMQQFYNDRGMDFESVSSIFNNITSSMTTYIRQSGHVNASSPALGTVSHADTCIRVRWALIAYPAVLTVITLLFFMAMIVQTKRGQQGVHHDFKSSPLALLFHGLGDDIQRRVERVHGGESNEVAELKSEAKDMWVRLRPTRKGWRFVSAEEREEREMH